MDFVRKPEVFDVVVASNLFGDILTDLSAQVTGSGTGDYGLWPSGDLYVPPSFGDGTQPVGAFNARGTWANLRMHVSELPEFGFDPRGWIYQPVGLPWPAGLPVRELP